MCKVIPDILDIYNGETTSPVTYALTMNAILKTSVKPEDEDYAAVQLNYLMDYNRYTGLNGTLKDIAPYWELSRQVLDIVSRQEDDVDVTTDLIKVAVEDSKGLGPYVTEIHSHAPFAVMSCTTFEEVVTLLGHLESDDTIPFAPYLGDLYLSHGRDIIEELEGCFCEHLIMGDGGIDYKVAKYFTAAGYPYQIEEKDSWGPLSSSITTRKGKLVFG